MSSEVEVVITGLGATTPLGGDVASTWEGMLSGRSGVRRFFARFHGRSFDELVQRARPLTRRHTKD